MPQIDSCEFGSITIDGRKYGQVLVIGDQVEERDDKKLRELFKTTHRVGEWETARLLSNNPEIVVIGTGQEGVLAVDEATAQKLNDAVDRLIILPTPSAVETYNKLIKENKPVNALIHTTC